jgi:hypothetical protein
MIIISAICVAANLAASTVPPHHPTRPIIRHLRPAGEALIGGYDGPLPLGADRAAVTCIVRTL